MSAKCHERTSVPHISYRLNSSVNWTPFGSRFPSVSPDLLRSRPSSVFAKSVLDTSAIEAVADDMVADRRTPAQVRSLVVRKRLRNGAPPCPGTG